MINILDAKPNVVSNDLTGYIIGVYGAFGSGKTTTMMQADKPLLLATEKGYLAIPGVIAIDIKSWSDFLTVVAQLKKPEARERYKTIVIDTLDNLAFYANEEVLAKNGVSKISDVPYGGGYVQLEAMFRKALKEIADRYGVIIIAHPNQKQEDIAVEGTTDPKKNQYWDLAVNKKIKGIAIGMMDLLIFVEHNRRPNVPNVAHFIASDNWEAKTRFANIVPSTTFSFENIKKAITDAAGVKAVTTVTRSVEETVERTGEDFSTLKARVEQFATELVAKKGLEPVKQKIGFILGKSLKDADIADYERLLLLEGELATL